MEKSTHKVVVNFRKIILISVFFNSKLQEAIEEETLEYIKVHKVYACGKRRVPVVHSGTEI